MCAQDECVGTGRACVHDVGTSSRLPVSRQVFRFSKLLTHLEHERRCKEEMLCAGGQLHAPGKQVNDAWVGRGSIREMVVVLDAQPEPKKVEGRFLTSKSNVGIMPRSMGSHTTSGNHPGNCLPPSTGVSTPMDAHT